MINYAKLEQLQKNFPKLIQMNQQYILGVTEGLKYAQGNLGKPAENMSPDLTGQEEQTGMEISFGDDCKGAR
jgi:hypothetical protein